MDKEDMPPERDIPVVTTAMADKAKAEIENRRAGRHGLPLEDIAGATCPLCGSPTVRFADDLTFAAVLNRTEIKIMNLTGIRCSTCKDYAFDADSSKIIDQEIQDTKK